jgi:hypothetical protein
MMGRSLLGVNAARSIHPSSFRDGATAEPGIHLAAIDGPSRLHAREPKKFRAECFEEWIPGSTLRVTPE